MKRAAVLLAVKREGCFERRVMVVSVREEGTSCMSVGATCSSEEDSSAPSSASPGCDHTHTSDPRPDSTPGTLALVADIKYV